MKYLFLFFSCLVFGQEINGIQFFNPQTNDETPVISFNEKLILRFDIFSSSKENIRYTIKHLDRNWNEDDLFFNEYANGVMNDLITNIQYSFNTLQQYTHYEISFPNEKITPKISGNYEIIIYKNTPKEPLLRKRFCITENKNLFLKSERTSYSKNKNINQKIEIQAIDNGFLLQNINSVTANIIQNNNWNTALLNQKPSSVSNGKILFQQQNIAFQGNNEFYYFDNKNLEQSFDTVEKVETINMIHNTYLYPIIAYPMNYQYQPDVNGAFYFRRNDFGTERDANTEGDYSWVYFSLESNPIDKDIYILGSFNDYKANEKSKMIYDQESKKYLSKIYLKQGFYNYILATENEDKTLNLGEINGNFWQAENLYQAFLYYKPFGKNYDALFNYGETRR